ncbi:rhomboid family intramembrane serine protease [Psychrobacter sp.]|uniref:rhomboid family intramembrane serine protease n=1 Tax=Psychrobacter sp. TaxID=56811 RepID=UPI0025DE54B5|nr:rhomboid family intramembrane serine protease [Psychrobacter sp.]
MPITTLARFAPITLLLLLSFIGLFVIQIASGVDINEPSLKSLLKWGANALPYTIGNEPWRLISSAFLHIGLMHLLFNCFAMYYFGQAAEVTFGSVKFLLLFLLSAVGGNLLNSYITWWQILHYNGVPGVSAGASGGIMGIGMALLMVELLKKILPNFTANGSNTQLKSLAIIMAINLLYGFAVPGIDNAGHIGGAVTGAILAVGIMLAKRYSVSSDNFIFKALPWLFFAIIALIFYKLWLDLHLLIGL